MTKRDIKYLIEQKKYEFELKYQKDFRSVILAFSALTILVLELFLRGEIAIINKGYVILAIILLVLTLAISIGVYILKQISFFKEIYQLINKMYDKNN